MSDRRRRLWQILEVAEDGDNASRIFDIAISCVITIAVLAVILESVPALKTAHESMFKWLEWGCLGVFIPEYFLRLWACKSDDRYKGKYGRLRWFLSPMAVIDLISIIPSLCWFCGWDLRFLRAVRLMRLLRLAGYSKGLRILHRTFAECRSQLTICLSGMLVLLVIASSLLYFAEHEANPESFGSIPSSMWWGICTLTTVGYGDAVPVTTIGKLMSSVISIMGIGIFALPAGIIAGNIEKVWKVDANKDITCPHCGESFPSDKKE
ncbi:MAG: ion transporter [Planctomycetes bacterium]|nr:ion transporter [Planctomycetota bacterium]